jgi:hypothetical protein
MELLITPERLFGVITIVLIEIQVLHMLHRTQIKTEKSFPRNPIPSSSEHSAE